MGFLVQISTARLNRRKQVSYHDDDRGVLRPSFFFGGPVRLFSDHFDLFYRGSPLDARVELPRHQGGHIQAREPFHGTPLGV